MTGWPMRHVIHVCSEWLCGCRRTEDTCQVQASTKPGLQRGRATQGPWQPPLSPAHTSPHAQGCWLPAGFSMDSLISGEVAELSPNSQLWSCINRFQLWCRNLNKQANVELREDWKSMLPGSENVLGWSCNIYAFISNKSITTGHGSCLKHQLKA